MPRSSTITSELSSNHSKKSSNLNDSIYATISESNWFQNMTMAVIVLNAVWIGVDVEENHERLRKDGKLPLEPFSTVVENLFCIYFTIELIIRFLAFRRKLNCLWDAWFVFDSVLVTMMILETWILAIVEKMSGGGDGGGVLSNFSTFRLLRLARLTRMAKLMQSFPEVLTMCKGMVAAIRAVAFILVFLVLVIYVFAIVYTSVLGTPKARAGDRELEAGDYCYEPEPERWAICQFSSMGDSMMLLWSNGLLGDNLFETMFNIKAAGLHYFWFFVLFFVITSGCLLNMIIGILFEVVQDVSEEEREGSNSRELQTSMLNAFAVVDCNDDGLVSVTEWNQVKMDDKVRNSLTTLGVEKEHMDERLKQLQATLFGRDGEDLLAIVEGKRPTSEEIQSHARQSIKEKALTFDKFIEKLMAVRPDRPASALDIELLKAKIRENSEGTSRKLMQLENLLANYDGSNLTRSVSGRRVLPIPPSSKADPSRVTDGPNWLHNVPFELLKTALTNRQLARDLRP